MVEGPRNVMEDLVKKAVNEIAPEYPELCICNRCQVDIIALTLNKLGPKYVVSSQGEIQARVELAGRQPQIDILLAVRDAIEQVVARPHHHRL